MAHMEELEAREGRQTKFFSRAQSIQFNVTGYCSTSPAGSQNPGLEILLPNCTTHVDLLQPTWSTHRFSAAFYGGISPTDCIILAVCVIELLY